MDNQQTSFSVIQLSPKSTQTLKLLAASQIHTEQIAPYKAQDLPQLKQLKMTTLVLPLDLSDRLMDNSLNPLLSIILSYFYSNNYIHSFAPLPTNYPRPSFHLIVISVKRPHIFLTVSIPVKLSFS